MTPLGYENILRLDVAMNDAFRMGCVQSIGYFNRQSEQSLDFDGLLANQMFQRHAVKEFHGDKRISVLLPNIVNRANARVIQCRCSLRFALKPGECLRVIDNLGRQELERDKAAKARVFRFENDAHAATAELFNDAVMRDCLPNQGFAAWHLRNMLGCVGRQVNERSSSGP